MSSLELTTFEELTRQQCITAVEQRDGALDGVFVFAVKTTGIYCRPSCPARTPNRPNIEFYPTPDDAQAAGYRACKRCLPDQRDPQLDLVERVVELLQQPDSNSLRLNDLAQRVHVSPSHLHRTFKRVMGITPKQYADSVRRERFAHNLRSGQGVIDAAFDSGYASSSRVYEAEPLGMTPSTYRKGGRDMQMTYTIADCALGKLLVAETEKGVCAVSLGDTIEELVDALNTEYPHADISEGQAQYSDYVQQIVRHIEGRQPHLDLPLDIQVTAFQRLVLDTLRQIPYGETRTYTDIANTINKPQSVRAVARACATNPVAVVVPCHRVVRKDGGLAGYRWGLERKRRILETEQKSAED